MRGLCDEWASFKEFMNNNEVLEIPLEDKISLITPTGTYEFKNEVDTMEETSYYEKLYKIKGQQTIFMFVSSEKDSVLFNEFHQDDSRYWIEDEPKLIKVR